jgi:hypothetical protein
MEATKEVFVIQPNVISRARYIMPTMVRRIIFLAIFTVQITRPSDMRLSIPIHNLALMLRFFKTKRYEDLKKSITEGSKQILQYEKEDGSMTEWIPWLTRCKLDVKTNILNIKINPDLYDYILNIRQSAGFSFILLSDFLQLESQYALRWFEIVLSRSGHAKNNYYFVSYTLNEIRTTFAINENKYYRIKDFIKYVIENPIAEINKKNLGYNITPEYRYTAKVITSVFLHCKITKNINEIDPIASLIKNNLHKYYICRQEAENILHIQNFESQEAYQAEVTRKAIELLNEKVQNE